MDHQLSPRFSLPSRTVQALFGGLLLAAVLLTWVQYQARSRALVAEWDAHTHDTLTMLHASLEPLLEAGHEPGLRRAVADAVRYPKVQAVAIVDPSGGILVDSANRDPGLRLPIPAHLLRQTQTGAMADLRWTEPRPGGRTQFWLSPLPMLNRAAADRKTQPAFPQVGSDGPSGILALLVEVDLAPLEALQARALRQLVLINGLAFLALGFIGWGLLDRILGRPLDTVIQALAPLAGQEGSAWPGEGRTLPQVLARITKTLRERERFHQMILESLPAHLAILDREGRILAVNPSWGNLAREATKPFPAPASEGNNFLTACRQAPPEYAEKAREALAGVQSVLEGSLRQFSMEFSCELQGTPRWFLMSVHPLAPGSDGAVIAYSEISERKQAEDGLREALEDSERGRARLDALYSATPVGLIYVHPDLVVERVSQQVADVHRRSVAEHVGRKLEEVIPRERWSVLEPIYKQVLESGTPYYSYEEELPDPYTPGRTRFYTTVFYPDRDKEGTIRGVHVVMQDITELKLALQQQEQHLKELEAKNRELDQMAIRDPLTGLYNRRFFDEGLTREWQRFQRSGEGFSVIIMDVDALKKLNDRHGHEAGDRALQMIGTMLRTTLRETDLVARVGGDEFAALLPRTDLESSKAVVAKLHEAIKGLRLVLRSRPLPLTLSLGTATVPGLPPASSAAELLRVADKRMYEAKRLASARQTDAG